MATERCRVRGWVGALGALAMAWGCSSGGGGGGTPATTTLSLNASLPAAAQAISVTGGNSMQTAQNYSVPGTLGPISVTGVTVDLAATLAAGAVTLKASRKAGGPAGSFGAAGDPVATMMVWVGEAGLGTFACGNGFAYGPFAITETGAGGVAVDPPTATAGRQTLSVINTGSATICVEIDADQDIDANIGKVAMDATTCDESASDMGGDWSGTYTCVNTGGCASESGDVFIVLLQQSGSHSATYSDDGEGEFSGTVCRNEFVFDGGYGTSVTENGTFTRTGPGTARKHSEWHEVGGTCGGVCDDTLTQIAAF